MSGRSPEEREAARLERERKRAAREGRPFEEPAAPEPEGRPFLEHPPAPEPDHPGAPPEDRQLGAPVGRQSDALVEPQPTQQFDVTADWTEEHAVLAVAPSGTAHEPAPDHEPEAPLGTRRVAPHEHPRLAARRPAGGGAKTPPTAPRVRRRAPRRILAILALAVIAVAGWFLLSLYQPFAGDGEGRVAVRIPTGAGVSDVGDLLVERDVISSAFFFRLRASMSGDTGKLKAGKFTLKHDMSYAAALDALMKNPPPPPVIHVTLPEGPSRGELALRVTSAGLSGNYVALTRSSKALNPRRYGAPKSATLEGFLFPATYELKRRATAKDLIAAQLTAFKQNLAGIDLRYARSKNLTVFDLVTIASMIEREVAVAKERPLVAAVIYNRLHDGIPLGIDATLRFGLGNWSSPLKVSELESDTPYNTRNHQGLPPGPIGNPGLASLQAAAHPAKVGYLYYVVKPGTCGEHVFATTDADAQRNVARYNAARDAAGGKSPTKC